MKYLLITIIWCSIVMLSNAQTPDANGYIHYDPLPYVPEPDPTPLPQPMYTPPPPLNYPPPNYSAPAPQPTEEVNAIYLITDAVVDNMDMTDVYVGEQAKIVIYTRNGTANMSIIRLKTNSETFGQVSYILPSEKPATSTMLAAKVLQFTWTFQNSYNTDKGIAYVQLTEINRPDGVVFVCQVKFPDRVSYFKGIRQR